MGEQLTDDERKELWENRGDVMAAALREHAADGRHTGGRWAEPPADQSVSPSTNSNPLSADVLSNIKSAVAAALLRTTSG